MSGKERNRKPMVDKMKAREWLRRHESGEAILTISKTDFYDPRTVKKLIERVRQEREFNEAKQFVMRSAIEKHYTDLCVFTEKIWSSVNQSLPKAVPTAYRDESLWKALKQHLPNSPIWKHLNNVNTIASSFKEAHSQFSKRVRELVVEQTGYSFINDPILNIGIHEGSVRALNDYSVSILQNGKGWQRWSYRSESMLHGRIINLNSPKGSYQLGAVKVSKEDKFQKSFSDLMNKQLELSEFRELEQIVGDFLNLKNELRKELDIITLRRIVPGKCVFCPI